MTGYTEEAGLCQMPPSGYFLRKLINAPLYFMIKNIERKTLRKTSAAPI